MLKVFTILLLAFLLLPTTASAVVQVNPQGQNVKIINKNDTRSSTHIDLDKPAPLAIKKISPSKVDFEQSFKVYGDSFGTNTGQVNFYTSDGQLLAAAPVSDWSETRITASVPALAGNKQYYVAVQKTDGKVSNKVALFVEDGQPIINEVSTIIHGPNGSQAIVKGQLITFTGAEFGKSRGKVIITQNNTVVGKATIKNWTENEIQFLLPTNITPGLEYGFQVETSNRRHTSVKYLLVFNP